MRRIAFYRSISLNFPTIFPFWGECIYKQRPFNFVVMNVGRRFLGPALLLLVIELFVSVSVQVSVAVAVAAAVPVSVSAVACLERR